jgi:hypothetical protein
VCLCVGLFAMCGPRPTSVYPRVGWSWCPTEWRRLYVFHPYCLFWITRRGKMHSRQARQLWLILHSWSDIFCSSLRNKTNRFLTPQTDSMQSHQTLPIGLICKLFGVETIIFPLSFCGIKFLSQVLIIIGTISSPLFLKLKIANFLAVMQTKYES